VKKAEEQAVKLVVEERAKIEQQKQLLSEIHSSWRKHGSDWRGVPENSPRRSHVPRNAQEESAAQTAPEKELQAKLEPPTGRILKLQAQLKKEQALREKKATLASGTGRRGTLDKCSSKRSGD
jgi:hypothetical protein